MAALVPHYGPDAEEGGCAAAGCGHAWQFALALIVVRDRSSGLLGRKGAEQLAQRIARG